MSQTMLQIQSSPIDATTFHIPTKSTESKQSSVYRHTSKHAMSAILHATAIAKALINHTCALVDLKVAPIEVKRMEHAVMTAQAPFILMNVSSVIDRMGYVFVPSALARHLIQSGTANKVVWDSPLTIDQEKTALLNMWESIPYDVYIAIDETTDFTIGDSTCRSVSNNAGSYSFVTSLIHEMIHAMGVFSLVNPDRGGGIDGHLSIFDAFLKTTQSACAQDDDDSCFLFESHNAQEISGNTLAATSERELWMNSSRVYNPPVFSPGSSMSHFVSSNSVMQPSIGDSTCRFEITASDVDALVQMGWDTCNASHRVYEWDFDDLRLYSDTQLDLVTPTRTNFVTDKAIVHIKWTAIAVGLCVVAFYTYIAIYTWGFVVELHTDAVQLHRCRVSFEDSMTLNCLSKCNV
jgi:hypothetical protein